MLPSNIVYNFVYVEGPQTVTGGQNGLLGVSQVFNKKGLQKDEVSS